MHATQVTATPHDASELGLDPTGLQTSDLRCAPLPASRGRGSGFVVGVGVGGAYIDEKRFNIQVHLNVL